MRHGPETAVFSFIDLLVYVQSSAAVFEILRAPIFQYQSISPSEPPLLGQ